MLKIWADVAWDDYCKFFELNQKKADQNGP